MQESQANIKRQVMGTTERIGEEGTKTIRMTKRKRGRCIQYQTSRNTPVVSDINTFNYVLGYGFNILNVFPFTSAILFWLGEYFNISES